MTYIVSGFAACKRSHKMLAFDGFKIKSSSTLRKHKKLQKHSSEEHPVADPEPRDGMASGITEDFHCYYVYFIKLYLCRPAAKKY